jgi:hypothetical protein
MSSKMTVQQYQNCQALADFVDHLPPTKHLSMSQIRQENACGTNACLVGWMPDALPGQVRMAWKTYPGWEDAPLAPKLCIISPAHKEPEYHPAWFDDLIEEVLGIPPYLRGMPPCLETSCHGVFFGHGGWCDPSHYTQRLRETADRVWRHDHGHPYPTEAAA